MTDVNRMSPERVEKFRPFVLRKIKAEGLDFHDTRSVESALSRCVMGIALVGAYREMAAHNAEAQVRERSDCHLQRPVGRRS